MIKYKLPVMLCGFIIRWGPKAVVFVGNPYPYIYIPTNVCHKHLFNIYQNYPKLAINKSTSPRTRNILLATHGHWPPRSKWFHSIQRWLFFILKNKFLYSLRSTLLIVNLDFHLIFIIDLSLKAINTLCFPMWYLSLRPTGRVPSKIALTMSLLPDCLKENSGLYLEIITNYYRHSDNPT